MVVFLSLSLLLFSSFFICHLECLCVYVCVVLISLTRSFHRQRKRERERREERLCGYKKISNTKKDILFRCRSLLHICIRGREVPMNIDVRGRRTRKKAKYIEPNRFELRLLMDVYIYIENKRFLCVYTLIEMMCA